jgi:aspartyl/asparaginyl beta-hydroxylase (cupin superfamily)
VPRLPPIPFYERAQFPWIDALEARTEAIRQELETALAETRQDFTPYVAYRPGDPVNQWAELNHSPRWSAYHLYRGGTPVTEHLARCPITAAALAEAELATIEGLCPNAMFSALEPGTHIPPHHGETNARVVVHLPLIVPEGCSFRVGYETRRWQTGRCLIFDDTIEHEARNDGPALRVVLIFDTWNPLLSAEERVWVATLAAARKRYLDEAPDPTPVAG